MMYPREHKNVEGVFKTGLYEIIIRERNENKKTHGGIPYPLKYASESRSARFRLTARNDWVYLRLVINAGSVATAGIKSINRSITLIMLIPFTS
jgi:hypothetical protein